MNIYVEVALDAQRNAGRAWSDLQSAKLAGDPKQIAMCEMQWEFAKEHQERARQLWEANK
jgi:hypothetical protein